MPTARPIRSAWKSLWKKSRKGRLHAGLGSPDALEVRMLPAAVTLTASVDGYARDANRDNVFTALETAGSNLLVRSTTGTNTGFERSMLEFDLSQISTALTVNSATLVINVSQLTKSGTTFPSVDVYGYTGNGAIELTDASVAGTFIGHTSVTATGQLRIDLDANFIRSQGGGFLGIRLQNPVLNGPYGVFSALESAAADPQLELNTSLNVQIDPVDIDEQRPNGTFVVDAGIGNNASYAKLPGGDDTNVFALNPTTGRITVADSSQLKFAIKSKYVITIQATLPDGTVGTYDVQINVKNVFGPNHKPVVTDSQFTIEEFAPVGTVVGTVDAVDPDSADPLSYAITAGNIGNAFKIDSKTGQITVNNQAALSLRSTPSIVLQVSVRDTRTPRETVVGRVEVFLTPRQLAVTTSPNSVQILPSSDGEAQDLNNDGIFESVDTTSDTIQVKGAPARRRGIMEFNLASVGTSKIVKGAFLTIYVQGNVGNNIPVTIRGYQGDGTVTASDAILGGLIATRNFSVNTVGDLKAYTIELGGLGLPLIQQIVAAGGTLGIVLMNEANSNAIIIDSSEGPANNSGDSLARRPSLNLVLEDNSDDVVLVNTTNQALTVGRSTGSAFTTFAASALRQGVTFAELLTGDFNGDGRLDIAGRNAANGQILVALAAANQFVTGAAWTTFSTVTSFSDVLVGDFNGDGKDDIVGRSAQGQLLVATSVGNKFNNLVFETLPANLRTLSNVRVGDFNGDGRDDLVGIVATTGQVVVSISNGNSFTSSVWGTVPIGAATSDVIVGDFNGDGRDDLYTRQGVGSQVVLRSTGSSFDSALFGTLPPGVPYIGFRKGDFNGDGLDDIVGFTATGASTIFKSSGADFGLVGGGTLPMPALSPPSPGNPAPTLNQSDIVIGDFNRDGKSDILVHSSVTTVVNNISTTTQQLFVSLGTGPYGGPFTTSLWGTFKNAGPFTLLGVGNY